MNPKTLRILREQKGITQEELGKQIHVSPSAISQYERGIASPSHDTETRLAQYFSVSVNFLNDQSDFLDIELHYHEKYGNNSTLFELIQSMLRLTDEHRNSLAMVIQAFEKEDTTK